MALHVRPFECRKLSQTEPEILGGECQGPVSTAFLCSIGLLDENKKGRRRFSFLGRSQASLDGAAWSARVEISGPGAEGGGLCEGVS